MSDKRVVSLVLNAEKDADILRWLDAQDGSKSEAIRSAIRAQIGTQGVTLGGIYQAIKDLDRKLSRGVRAIAGTEDAEDDYDAPDEPADLAEAIDNLGL